MRGADDCLIIDSVGGQCSNRRRMQVLYIYVALCMYTLTHRSVCTVWECWELNLLQCIDIVWDCNLCLSTRYYVIKKNTEQGIKI